MPRFRITYQSSALFAGPAPASGLHFSNLNQQLNNDFNDSSVFNQNLIQYINRVQSVEYNVNLPRVQVKALGNVGNLTSYSPDAPTVSLGFNYLQMGVINEYKLGFYVNYQKPEPNGQAVYENNDNVFLLSGFYSRSLNRRANAIGYPFDYRDCRNMFLAISTREGFDLNRRSESDPYDSMTVLGFGNCYITSYQSEASVGNFPICSVGYICDNLQVYNSGSGIGVPALNTRTYEQFSGVKAVIPNNYQDELVTVLNPGDITIDISSHAKPPILNAIDGTGFVPTGSTNNRNMLINMNDVHIDRYSLGMNFGRYSLRSVSHRLPLDRRIDWPVIATLNFGMTVASYETGSLRDLAVNSDEYNVNVNLRNPICSSNSGIGVQYAFKRAKFNGISFNTDIGSNLVANLSFTTELDPHDLSKGLFVSGLLNLAYAAEGNDILTEENDFLATEEDDNESIMTEESEAFVGLEFYK